MMFDHVMLNVRNLDLSLEFYKAAFGMKVFRMHTALREAFIGFDKDGTMIELNEGVDIITEFGHLALRCENCEAATERAVEHGAVIVTPPGKIPGHSSTLSYVSDLDGYVWGLVQVNQ